MKRKDFKFDPKTIEPSEHSPVVSTLLSVIEKLTNQLSQQSEALARQSEKIDALLNEIRQLKKLSKKPKLRASNLPKDPDNKNDDPPEAGNGNSKRPVSSKRSKKGIGDGVITNQAHKAFQVFHGHDVTRVHCFSHNALGRNRVAITNGIWAVGLTFTNLIDDLLP
jgi:uncharacterized coiled-coil protein SlyX